MTAAADETRRAQALSELAAMDAEDIMTDETRPWDGRPPKEHEDAPAHLFLDERGRSVAAIWCHTSSSWTLDRIQRFWTPAQMRCEGYTYLGPLRLPAASSPPPGGAVGVPFQGRVHDWIIACFGAEIGADRVERNHRFLEEALELVQSGGCTASEAHQLVDYVFHRPVGELGQEVGGVMNTLAALCTAHGVDLDAEAERELARVWTKVEVIRAKQAAKPKHSPLPGPTTPPPSARTVAQEGVQAGEAMLSVSTVVRALEATRDANPHVTETAGHWCRRAIANVRALATTTRPPEDARGGVDRAEAMREACAKIADEFRAIAERHNDGPMSFASQAIAFAIRALLTTTPAPEATDPARTVAPRGEGVLREVLSKFLTWAEQKCPCENEQPNPCPLCGASVENLEPCKAADRTLPRHLLDAARTALRADASGDGGAG